MRPVAIVVAGGLAIIAAVAGVTLPGTPISVARESTAQRETIGTLTRPTRACQADEVLPARTSAIRLQAFASIGPRVTVEVLAHGHVIAHGERAPGWTGGVVTVPVSPLATATSGATLCFALFPNGNETIVLTGGAANGASAAQGSKGAIAGRLVAEYMRPGPRSWWSLLASVVRRMGLGHALGGAWNVVLTLLLMVGVLLLSARATLRYVR
jgi:hypothetical protein